MNCFTGVEIAVKGRDRLGETPVWDDRTSSLYWVDIRSGLVHRWETESNRLSAHQFNDLATFVALTRDSRLIVGTRKSVGYLDFENHGFARLVDIEHDKPHNRINEARCDRQGRLWFGSMRDGDRRPDGALYQLESDASVTIRLEGITVPNSLAWSPDGRFMYFADTSQHTIQQFKFEPETGTIGAPEPFADLSENQGRPDGSAIDAEGCLWNAQPGSGRVVRYTPDGREDRIVHFPVRDVTALCFGGADLRTLFVTSATQRLSANELAAAPQSGCVFAVRCEISGLPEPRCVLGVE